MIKLYQEHTKIPVNWIKHKPLGLQILKYMEVKNIFLMTLVLTVQCH